MILNLTEREIKKATSLTEGELKTKRRRPGELTQSILTGGLRPRTVSKPSRSLQGGCGPLVRHNSWHTACLLRMETVGGASTEALLLTGGQEEAGNVTHCIDNSNTKHKQSRLTITTNNSASRSDGRYRYTY